MKKLGALISYVGLMIMLCIVSPVVEAATQVTVSPGQSIQSAINSLGSNGGEVIVQAGTYKEFITFNNSNVTLKANGKVIIDGQGRDGYLMDLNGKSNITIDGFTLTNLKGNDIAGIYLGGGEKNIQLLNNEIYNLHATRTGSNGSCVNGILLFGESRTPISNVMIKGNHLYNMTLNWSEALSVAGNAEYVYVHNNKVHDVTNIGIDFCGNFGYAPVNDQPRNCEAIGNIIYNCKSTYATSYGLYADGAYNILFKDNVIYNCQGGIEVGAEEKSSNYIGGVTVVNNLVYGCTENGLHIGGYDASSSGVVKDVKVYNNTFVNNTDEIYLSKCDGVELYNNIFYNTRNSEILYNEFSSTQTKNVKFHDNLYYTKGSAEFYFVRKSYSQNSWLNSIESSALFQDPKLDSNYLPTSSTPAGKGYKANTVVEPETPVVPDVPEKPQEPVEPETPVVPEEPEEEEPETPVGIIYDSNAIYYSNNPTQKSATYFAKYDVLVFNSKYNSKTNSSYTKMQKLIKEIQTKNPDVVIVFVEKLG